MVEDRPRVRRKRSPSYPYISLEQAIDLIRVLHKQEGYSYTPAYTALEHLNYSPTSSSGARVLATLFQFGLLDETGSRNEKRVRLSDTSMTIMEAPDEQTRVAAIQEAALNPEIHKEVWKFWNLDSNPLPPDSTMRFKLLKEFGFHKNAVDGFIEQFKNTYFFAQLDHHTIEPTTDAEAIGTTDPGLEQTKVTVSSSSQIPQGMKEHTIQLIGQPMARLVLPHPISKRNLQHLISWLELMGPALIVPEGDYEASSADFDDEFQH